MKTNLEGVVKMEYEKIMVLADYHIPYEDRITINKVYKLMKDYKPNTIILLGDIVDFTNISYWLKNKNMTDNIQLERKKVIRELTHIRSNHPKSRIIYVKGNHEDRLEKYILEHAEELAVLPELQLNKLFKLKELKIDYVNKRYLKYKGILFSHINKALKNGTARNLVKDYGCDVVHAHSHKIDFGVWGDHYYADIGCLCLEQQPYLEKPTYFTQGVLLITIKNNQKYFEPIIIKNHTFKYGNKIY